MDDIKYSFFQDVKEKKVTSTGAYHKKGTKSKKMHTLLRNFNRTGKEKIYAINN